MQTLLCRAVGASPSTDGATELSERLQADIATTNAGFAAALENSEAHFRQFNERSFSQRCPNGIHQAGVRCDEQGPLASISGSNETVGACARIKQGTGMGSANLDGCECRI